MLLLKAIQKHIVFLRAVLHFGERDGFHGVLYALGKPVECITTLSAMGARAGLKTVFIQIERRWGMNRSLFTAGMMGLTAVGAGAFGAHALQASVTSERIQVWETAAQYHLIHSVVILLLALQSSDGYRWRLLVKGFTAGVLLFSFSLYALVLTDITVLAMVTPLGGLVLMASWCALAVIAVKSVPGK